MGCQECSTATDEQVQLYPYRWKNATVMILACATHAREIMIALSLAQNDDKKEEP
jgi:hypothetical protein